MNNPSNEFFKPKPKIGLAVVFAALSAEEHTAVEQIWDCACKQAKHWQPAFIRYGLEPLTDKFSNIDLLVYLGESSRFDSVAASLNQHVPVVLVKSTIEELMNTPAGSARRYRMSTVVDGIAQALAAASPPIPSVDWKTLPWPAEMASLLTLHPAEQGYVDKSILAFRKAVEERGLSWLEGLPASGQPFSVFLTMHDPTAAQLAGTALKLWPQATVIAADGMTSTHAPDGHPWPERLIRIRHWSPRSRSASNRALQSALQSGSAPDFDSPGMLFGTLNFLDHAFKQGTAPGQLENAGQQPGPLGPMRMTSEGRAHPERVVLLRGQKISISKI